MAHYFHAPGWQQYWALRSDLYSPTFRAYVAALPPPERRRTAGGLGDGKAGVGTDARENTP
jgi:hypothetical protein